MRKYPTQHFVGFKMLWDWRTVETVDSEPRRWGWQHSLSDAIGVWSWWIYLEITMQITVSFGCLHICHKHLKLFSKYLKQSIQNTYTSALNLKWIYSMNSTPFQYQYTNINYRMNLSIHLWNVESIQTFSIFTQKVFLRLW